jgi:hypothetical protein
MGEMSGQSAEQPTGRRKWIPLTQKKIPGHEQAPVLPAQAEAEERNPLKNKDIGSGHEVITFFS